MQMTLAARTYILFLILLSSSLDRISCFSFKSTALRSISKSDSKVLEFYKGVISPKVERVEVGDEGGTKESLRCLIINEKVDKGEILINLPAPNALFANEDIDDSSDCPLPDDGKLIELWKKMKGTSRLSIKLMLEKRKNEKSAYHNYICDLPEKIDIPLCWESDTVARLGKYYKPLGYAIEKQQQQWSGLYKSLISTTSSFTEQNLSYGSFVWAMAIVRSRAFQGIGGMGGGNLERVRLFFSIASLLAGVLTYMTASSSSDQELYTLVWGSVAVLSLTPSLFASQMTLSVLIPMVDSANHDSKNPTGTLALEPSMGAFVVRARETVTKIPSQLTISYGNRNNDNLLQYFGFVESNNPHDHFIICDSLRLLGSLDVANDPIIKEALIACQKEMNRSTMGTSNAQEAMIIKRGESLDGWQWDKNFTKFISYLLKDDKIVSDEDCVRAIKRSKLASDCLSAIIKAELMCMEDAIYKQNQLIEQGQRQGQMGQGGEGREGGNGNVKKEEITLRNFFVEKQNVLKEAMSTLEYAVSGKQ